MTRALVTGAGGFIGSHLVSYLKAAGYWVRGADLKRPEFGDTDADEFEILDLREDAYCTQSVAGIEEVYHLAADMGGIGYITTNHAELSRNNVLMDANMLHASHADGVERFFYASSACVYPAELQTNRGVDLAEEDAIPAEPEPGYGWEKLFAEQLAQYAWMDQGLETRVARFHNIYGPMGTYEGGREKAPAALCRKVAVAADGSNVEVWGDGQQTRSFTYIDDCVEGIHRITRSDHRGVLNLGSDERVTIDELAWTIIAASGKDVGISHDAEKPQGVRGRNSDNRLCEAILGWTPTTSLAEGIERTYGWISGRVHT